MIHKITGKFLNLSLREKTLIVILICLVFVFFTTKVLLPQYDAYKSIQKQILIKKQQIILLNEQIASLPREKIAVKKIEEQWKGLENYFPREINDGTVLETIGTIVNSCNLQLNSFTPQEPVVKDYYKELPVKCVVSGDFSKVVTFVDQIEHQPNLIVIKDMVFENLVNKDETNSAKVEISLILYSQRTNTVEKDTN